MDFAIPSLDGLRAVSVLIVVSAHAGFGHFIPGGLGVTIFFFLSGYLITTLFIKEFEYTNSIAIPAFYARRMLRLFPPLLIALAIAYALTAMNLLSGGITVAGIASQLLYFANYHGIFFATVDAVPTGTGILWSLAVEEHFYLLYPFVVLAAIRLRLSPLVFVAFLITACLAILAWRCYLATGAKFNEARTYYASDTRFDSIIFGCILALVANPALERRAERRLRIRDFGILVASLTLLFSTIIFRDPLFRETIRYTLQGIALCPIFYYAIKYPDHHFFAWLNSKPIRRIGVYSYAIYLIHFVVLNFMFEQVPYFLESSALSFVGGLAISIAFAFLVDRFVDSYFRRLRHRFRIKSIAENYETVPKEIRNDP